MPKSQDNQSSEQKTARFTPLSVVLATGLGIGLIRRAPGTWGSLLALPFAWMVGQFSQLTLQIVLVVAFCFVSIPIATAACRQLGRGKDPGCIVIDEIAGILITFLLIPMSSAIVVVEGFLLFRLFDISKLPPARQLERLPVGLGIMADDWAAAIYANLSLRLLLYLSPPSGLL